MGLGRRGMAAVLAVAALTLGVALGGSSRLSYHEAIEAQAAREVIAGGDWLVPTLGGRPWLEKPPGPIWMIAGLGKVLGGVDEAVARLPGVLAAAGLALAVATLAARRFGREVGVLAGAVQATSAWLVTKGRLAESDVPLACVVAWAIVAFDGMRVGGSNSVRWRLAFFGLLGLTAMAKGVAFGGVLVAATAAAVVAWDRDGATLRRLAWPAGWLIAAVLALAWPLAVLARHPEAMGLWLTHVSDRLADRPEHFAGESWGQYAPTPLVFALPWTPLALGGAWRSGSRAWAGSSSDRLLWAWAVVPAALVSMASARNGHYLVPAMPPWAIWGALGLARLGERLRGRGWSADRVRRAAAFGVAGVAMAWAVGYAALGPVLDRRGKGPEWAFYQEVGRALPAGERVVLLYDALDRPDPWDRRPYPTPFGPVPPDLAARLFYLDRPGVAVAFGPEGLDAAPFAVVARERDRPALERLGSVRQVAAGPTARWDRAFVVYRIEEISRKGAKIAKEEKKRFLAEARRTRRARQRE